MTDKRNFNQSQRRELFLKADGKCQICSCDISLDNFHADHKIPFCEGGKTELNNGQALCPQCNLKKASLFNIESETKTAEILGNNKDLIVSYIISGCNCLFFF